MSSMALFAIQRGVQTGLAISDAFKQQAMAELNADAISRQMDELNRRTNQVIGEINQQADQVTAEQQAAFIGSGVKLEGSAMSVVADTLSEAAQAMYIRRRESDYQLANLGVEKAAFDRMASNESLLLNLTGAVATGAAGMGADAYKYNRTTLRDRGASGLGENPSADVEE